MLRLLYSLAWLLALPLVAARLWWRGRKEPGYRQHWRERFGMYAGAGAAQLSSAPGGVAGVDTAAGTENAAGRHQLIWLHAVSVGETRAAEPLLTALLAAYPQASILLTHMTPTGRETGRTQFARHGARVLQSYLPYDLVWLVQRFLRHFKPVACILMETEVWPNLLCACERAGVPVALVNARLSERSMRRGQKMGSLMLGAARRITLVAAQTQQDAERIRALGAPHVTVTGSIKFDVAIPPAMLELGQRLRQWIGDRPVLLCASTREGEEALLLPELKALLQVAPPADGDAVSLPPASQSSAASSSPASLSSATSSPLASQSSDSLSDFASQSSLAPSALSLSSSLSPLLLLVPRHPQRFDEVAHLVAAHGLTMLRRSAITAESWQQGTMPSGVQVLLGDSMGEMFAYCAACDVAFIGGSLLPLGGQNLIEACALGKPVLIGPHTFNFLEVTELALAAGAAQRVASPAELVQAAAALLNDAATCRTMGAAALEFAVQHRGATARTLALLARLPPLTLPD